MGELQSAINLSLGDHLRSIFTNVQLDVEIGGAFDIPDNSELTVKISCNFESNGVRYGLSRAIDLLGTSVKRIYQLNETGTLT